MPRGTRRVLHAENFPCGVGGGYWSSDGKVTCSRCQSLVPTPPDPGSTRDRLLGDLQEFGYPTTADTERGEQ